MLERTLAGCSVVVMWMSAAQAQSLGPDAPRVEWVDRLAVLRGGAVHVRWDESTGSFARLRLEGARPLTGTGSTAVARWIESELAPLLESGLRAAGEGEPMPGVSALRWIGTRQLEPGRFAIHFEQVSAGYPLLGHGVQVEVEQGAAGTVPTLVLARFQPDAMFPLPLAVDPRIDAALRTRFPTLETALPVERLSERPVVTILHQGRPRATFVVDHAGPGGRPMRSYVDASTGEVLREERRGCTATAEGQVWDKNPGQTPRAGQRLAGLHVTQGVNRATTDANGVHPLTGTVMLERGMSGPLVRVFTGAGTPLVYAGPAEIRLAQLESSPEQDEVAAFQHYMRFNAHLRATYPLFAASRAIDTRFALVVRDTTNGQRTFGAYFLPGAVQMGGEEFPGMIGLGAFGERETARSSSVVQHEYTHALLDRIVDLGGEHQAMALNEGLADYFTSAKDDDPLVGRWVYEPEPFIRDLSKLYRWPDDFDGTEHRTGNMFAGALWEARTTAGAAAAADRLRVDQAAAAAVFRLPPRPTLLDARDAVVESDRVVNQGRFRRVLEDTFARRGIGPAAQNAAPSLANPGDKKARVGAQLKVLLQASDPDGDPLTLMASALRGAKLEAGTFTFTPGPGQEGTQKLTFTASDGDLSSSRTIAIEVAPAPASTAPASTVAAPTSNGATRKGGGGGGGGCSLVASSSSPDCVLVLVLVLVLGLRRR